MSKLTPSLTTTISSGRTKKARGRKEGSRKTDRRHYRQVPCFNRQHCRSPAPKRVLFPACRFADEIFWGCWLPCLCFETSNAVFNFCWRHGSQAFATIPSDFDFNSDFDYNFKFIFNFDFEFDFALDRLPRAVIFAPPSSTEKLLLRALSPVDICELQALHIFRTDLFAFNPRNPTS